MGTINEKPTLDEFESAVRAICKKKNDNRLNEYIETDEAKEIIENELNDTKCTRAQILDYLAKSVADTLYNLS